MELGRPIRERFSDYRFWLRRLRRGTAATVTHNNLGIRGERGSEFGQRFRDAPGLRARGLGSQVSSRWHRCRRAMSALAADEEVYAASGAR